MQRQSESFELRGETFEVRELSVRELLPLIKNMSTGSIESHLPLIAQAVYKDGEQLGDAAYELPGVAYFKLLPVVLRVNSLEAKEVQVDEDGNPVEDDGEGNV